MVRRQLRGHGVGGDGLDVLLDTGDLSLLPRVGISSSILLRALSLQVVRVATGVGCDRVRDVVQFQHRRDHRVQEGAIVRDDENRATVLTDKALQPEQGITVEVVGGLVQEEQVGPACQQRCQPCPCLLSTGQHCERSCKIDSPHAEHIKQGKQLVDRSVATPSLECSEGGVIGA